MPPGPDIPFVSVLMPCYNEARHIEDCLRSVLAQTYARDRIEILVADGRSTDDTRQRVQSLAREDPRIQLIDNPARHQAAALNRCIRQARGDVLVRMDAHCEYAADYVERCVDALARTGADVVGGPQQLKAVTPFQRAVTCALGSPLGMGGAPFRVEGRTGFVDTVFLGSFRRSVFETVGLYDESAVPNEDSELNQRVIEQGGRIFLDPAIRVTYHPRGSLRALARQYFHYGRGRARTMLKHRRLLTFRPVAPFVGLVGLSGLLVASWFNPGALALLVPYPLAVGFESVRMTSGLPLAQVLRTLAVFPTLHFAHGVGFGVGLVQYTLRPDWKEPALLPPHPTSVR
jgi:succinoglycan biosynthesis protein ExoA